MTAEPYPYPRRRVIGVHPRNPELATLPVVMLSVLGDEELAYALGAQDYLLKPVDRDALTRSVKRQLRGLPRESILVIEDDPDIHAALAKALQTRGYRVVCADGAHAAVEQLRKQPPCLIVLDLVTPSIDGFEFISMLRAQETFHSIPVVALTATELNEEQRAQLRGVVQRVVRKGGHVLESLLIEVDSLLGARPTADQQSPAQQVGQAANA